MTSLHCAFVWTILGVWAPSLCRQAYVGRCNETQGIANTSLLIHTAVVESEWQLCERKIDCYHLGGPKENRKSFRQNCNTHVIHKVDRRSIRQHSQHLHVYRPQWIDLLFLPLPQYRHVPQAIVLAATIDTESDSISYANKLCWCKEGKNLLFRLECAMASSYCCPMPQPMPHIPAAI